MRFVRATVSLTLAAFATEAALPAQQVQIRLEGGQLRVAAPKLHFLSGRPLESLRDGASVAFDIQVSILADGRQSVLRRSFDRFVISYDLWEEKYSVTRMRSSRASVSRLTAAAAEAWCLDAFALSTANLPADRPLWIRIDVHARDGREREGSDEGLSLGALIELFSKPVRPNDPMQWRAESQPFELAQLRRTTSP